MAVENVRAGGVEAREVGSQRPSLDIDEAISGDEEVDQANAGRKKHRDCHQPDALAREPGSAPQDVVHPVH